MSGPKDYTPPPMYSMQVFDGKLNTVFHLQCLLKELLDEIEDMQTTDEGLNNILDIQTQVKKISKHNKQALKTLVFDYKGKFNQETYSQINKEIEEKIDLLNKQLSKAKSLKVGLQNKSADYEAWKQLIVFRKNIVFDFENFKNNTIDYIKQGHSASESSSSSEAIEKIKTISLIIEDIIFKDGLRDDKDSIKAQINSKFDVQENHIAQIRSHLCNDIAGSYETIHTDDTKKLVEEENAEIHRIEENIEMLIQNCIHAENREKYINQLEKLRKCKTLKQLFYFKELHDDILENEKLINFKNELQKLLVKVNISFVHAAYQNEKSALCNEIVQLLKAHKACDADLKRLANCFNTILEKSKKTKQEEDIKEKESLFLKTQIIHSLEKMGYEVMDDLNVIDFEKEDDILLKINGQNNYLNLKFKEDGSFRYVFQIPENKDKLSTDQQNLKLHEMHMTCEEFQHVLGELKQMGLKVSLRSAKPVALSSIISLSDKHKDKLSKSKSNQSKQNQIKKRYLDN